MKDCTTCKYGFVDEQLGFPMCHHPSRFSKDCVDFNMHEEIGDPEKVTGVEEKKLPEWLEEAATKAELSTFPMPEDGDIDKVNERPERSRVIGVLNLKNVMEPRTFFDMGFVDIKRQNDMNTPKNKLGEAARLYSDNQDASDYPDLFSREDIKSAFIAGAEWQKAKRKTKYD